MGQFLSQKKGRNLLAGNGQPEQRGRNLLAGRQYGEIRKPPSFGERAIAGLPKAIASAVPPVGIYQNPELLPLAGQVAGGMVGGYPGAVAGAGTGRIGSNILEGLKRRELRNPLQGVGEELAGTATIEGLFRGAGKLARPAANRLMLSIMKPGREVIKRNPSLGVEAVEQGIYGTKSGMLKKAENVVRKGEAELQGLIKGRPEKVLADQVADSLEAIKRPYANIGDDASIQAIEEVQNAIRKKGALTLQEANQLKRDLYAVVKESQFGKGVGEIPAKATARKQAAFGLKRQIQGAEPRAKAINRNIATGIEAREALENRIAQEAKNDYAGLANIGFGGSGLVTGALTGALSSDQNRLQRAMQFGLTGGLSGLAARNIGGSALLKSSLARAFANRLLGRTLTLGTSEATRKLSGT